MPGWLRRGTAVAVLWSLFGVCRAQEGPVSPGSLISDSAIILEEDADGLPDRWEPGSGGRV